MVWSDNRRFFHQRQYEAAMREMLHYLEHGYDQADLRRGEHSVGDLMGAIFSIDNDEDAARFFHGHVEDIQDQINSGTWKGRAGAEDSARANIGWCYGEDMPAEQRAMWERVTGARHPVLG